MATESTPSKSSIGLKYLTSLGSMNIYLITAFLLWTYVKYTLIGYPVSKILLITSLLLSKEWIFPTATTEGPSIVSLYTIALQGE